MIQFNLLPDVKLNFIKTERKKHLAITIAIISSIVALSALVFLVATVKLFQQKHLSDLAKDMDATASKIEEVKDLNKILTVQSQLNSLDSLHAQKPVTSRIYGYISKLTPADASISSIKLDFSTNTMEIMGKVPELAIVQRFADTLKSTTYHPPDKKSTDKTPDPAVFADVVLGSFSRQNEGASYTLKMLFDPLIFSDKMDATITIPNTTTAVAEQNRPTPLFQPAPTEGVQ